MGVRPIYHFPNDLVLRQKARRVSSIDGSVQRLIDDMIQTMQGANGVGLAAPQIGVPLRIIVLQMPEQEPIALINPEIVERAGQQDVTEGCLSVPGYFGEIKRSADVVVKGRDRRGKAVRMKATGLMAEALEHEVDHLNGILYVDRVEGAGRLHKIQPEVVGDKAAGDEVPTE